MRTPAALVRRVSALAAAGCLVLGGLSACSDDKPEDDGASGAEALAEAKTILDETSGVEITLTADDLPNGVTGITQATGVGVHPSAFEGSFDLVVSGLPATAEVIAVDGKTYARNSLLLPEWTDVTEDIVDRYGAPDPANFMDPETGFSNLLATATGVEKGDSVRGGEDNEEILTEYEGTLPAEVVAELIPSAAGDFDVVFTIADNGELRQAVMTGEFYEGEDELTYTLGLSGYDTEKEITAP